MQCIILLLPNSCAKHTKNICSVTKALMEKAHKENAQAADKYLETNNPATDTTTSKDNSKRFLSLLLFCTRHTELF